MCTSESELALFPTLFKFLSPPDGLRWELSLFSLIVVVLRSKAGVFPDLEISSYSPANFNHDVGSARRKRVWKRQTNPPRHLRHLKQFGCRYPVLLVLAPACAALRFGLLLSAAAVL